MSNKKIEKHLKPSEKLKQYLQQDHIVKKRKYLYDIEYKYRKFNFYKELMENNFGTIY